VFTSLGVAHLTWVDGRGFGVIGSDFNSYSPLFDKIQGKRQGKICWGVRSRARADSGEG
jgi:hypothetical protein